MKLYVCVGGISMNEHFFFSQWSLEVENIVQISLFVPITKKLPQMRQFYTSCARHFPHHHLKIELVRKVNE